jgi:succinate dehydrogenase/fumarate reductase flavoprotein subunit
MLSEQDSRWDREVDLLVAGAGAGGMAAALVGSLEGLDVLICEKTQQVGGTAATSAGTIWIPGNRQSRAAGFNDSADDAATYMRALIGDDLNRELREVYLQTGPDAVDYLMEKTDVQFQPCGRHPDYVSHLPGAAVYGRALVPEIFDGRLLGDDFKRVRAPIEEFLIFGGMMVGKPDIPRLLGRFQSVGNFWYTAKLFLRYLLDRCKYTRGTRLLMGNALVARLLYSLRKRHVPLLFGAPIEELIRQDGRILGAYVVHEGKRLRIKARKGVVLATGGFGHNHGFRQAFMPLPTPHLSLAFAGNVGDGVSLGRSAGAKIAPEDHGSGAFWTPVSITRRPNGEQGLFPHLAMDRSKPGVIAVNSAGMRFVDEAASYHHFVEAMYASHQKVPTIPAYLVCDADFIRKYGLGIIHPGTSNLARFEKSGYLITAESIEELATKISVDSVGLRATVKRYNEFAAAGVDLDFRKGESELGLFNGDPNHAPNPGLKPILGPLYCAVTVWPAEIGGSTGLATNGDATVLDNDGNPITGLYACGNDMASVMRGTYPGPGTTLGPALTFGYRAAMHAAHGSIASANDIAAA